ncbi:MAG TPA: hypothetical protein VF590_18720 [Isosphaeraceae bacterium]
MTMAVLPPAAIYREEQTFGWWVYAFLAVVIAGLAGLGLAWAQRAHPGAAASVLAWGPGLALGLTLPVVLVLAVLRMVTEVSPVEVRVWFGWLPTYRRVVPIAAVRGVEVVHYRPIADHGGWGIRRGRDGERVLTARGDRGVRLHLADGSRLLIGSQRPEELAAVLRRAMQPVV